MPTRIELLKQAGFSDDEIGKWAGWERLRMRKDGLTDEAIDDDLGITRPPAEIPSSFIDRMKRGNWASRVLGTTAEYAQNYFGDAPLGFSPEHQRLLGKLGILGDLTVAAAAPVDALARSVPAGVAALGAGAGQLIEEGRDAAFGPGPSAKGKAARDFAQLGQIAALLAGAKAPRIGAARSPPPKITNGPMIELPRAQDFRTAAASIADTPNSFKTERKLLRLWTEHGIPPTEVAVDALHDPAIAETMRSDSGKLPETYVGNAAPAEPSAAAGTESKSPSHPNSPDLSRTIEESKAIGLFDPPPKKPRPFSRDYGKDYKKEVRTDAQGRLLSDIEGRRLTAEFVAGRRFAGEADQRVLPDEIRRAMDKLEIESAELGPDKLRSTAAGAFLPRVTRAGPSGEILISSLLSPLDHDLVTAHEFGHAIDHFAQRISHRLTEPEVSELRHVYGTMRSGSEGQAFMAQPENYGYPATKIYSELMAEGLRAYMANPNYFKTVAPKTAAKIRAVVNESPYLRDVIQFNSLAAAGLVGAGARDQDRDDR